VRETARETDRSRDQNRAPGRFHHDRTGKTGLTGKQDLKAKAIGALRRLQKRPGLVRAFFAGPHLRYITAKLERSAYLRTP
jgi:hypothetical protein